MQINLGVHVCELGCVAPHQSPQVQEVGGGGWEGTSSPSIAPLPSWWPENTWGCACSAGTPGNKSLFVCFCSLFI